jgi:hypothetical protein
MDLIRKILLVTESDGGHETLNDHTEEQIAYHVQLLLDAKLIEGNVFSQNRAGRQSLLTPIELRRSAHWFS